MRTENWELRTVCSYSVAKDSSSASHSEKHILKTHPVSLSSFASDLTLCLLLLLLLLLLPFYLAFLTSLTLHSGSLRNWLKLEREPTAKWLSGWTQEIVRREKGQPNDSSLLIYLWFSAIISKEALTAHTSTVTCSSQSLGHMHSQTENTGKVKCNRFPRKKETESGNLADRMRASNTGRIACY